MTVEIVPQLQLEDDEKKQITEFLGKVNSLVALAGMTINDQADLAKSADAKLSIESYHKAVKAYFAAIIDPLDEELKRWKLQRANLMSTTEPALKALVDRQRAFIAEEKRRADEEQRRKQAEVDRARQQKIDEDNRAAAAEAKRKKDETVAQIEADFKAGLIGKREQARRLREAGAEEEAAKATADAVAEEERNKPAPTVRVAPSIPKMPGIRNQTFYYAEVTEEAAIIAAYHDATGERRAFLRQFIMVDSAAVSKYARDTKDNAKVMADLPGVKAWSKG